jgi:diguanylate cyclase
MTDSYQFGLHILFIVAIVQFVLGAAAAWLFGGSNERGDATAPIDTTDLEAMREKQRDDQLAIEDAMQQIYRLTGRIGHDVGEHSARVKQINDELADASTGSEANLKATLLAAVTKMTEANEKLQGELRTAEARMAEQAAALESQMAMARTDALTGALNRRAFDDEFNRRVSEFQRYRTPVSLLLFDIDHFKKFNDTYGHQTGDDVLCHVSCTLSMVMRDVDLVCRYGGEEFGVILPATDLAGAGLAAERARAAIERMVVESAGQELRVTASCGVATVLPSEDVAGCIARADQGLYASKRAGRNCVHLHDGSALKKLGAAANAAPTVAVSAPDKTAANNTNKNDEKHPALLDSLNQLPNREAFAEEVRRRIEQHQRYQAPVTIIYGGVDGYSTLVDKNGREAGNVVLRAVAQFIKALLRENEMLARVADDRFGLVLGGVDAGEAKVKVERILHAIQKCRLPIDGLENVHFTASFGLAEYEPGNDADTLMSRGSDAFAAAAKLGNNVHLQAGAAALTH